LKSQSRQPRELIAFFPSSTQEDVNDAVEARGGILEMEAGARSQAREILYRAAEIW